MSAWDGTHSAFSLGIVSTDVVQAPQILLQQLFGFFCGTRFIVMLDILSITMAHLKSALLRYLLSIDFSSSTQAGFRIFPFVLHWFFRRALAVRNWFEGFVLQTCMSAWSIRASSSPSSSIISPKT